MRRTLGRMAHEILEANQGAEDLVVIGIIALVLAARTVLVPKDFGVHERGYMYGWYRKGNIEDWKKNVQVKYSME